MRKGIKSTAKHTLEGTEQVWMVRRIAPWVHPVTKVVFSHVWLIHEAYTVSPQIRGTLQAVDNGSGTGKTQMFGLSRTQAFEAISTGRTLIHEATTGKATDGQSTMFFYTHPRKETAFD